MADRSDSDLLRAFIKGDDDSLGALALRYERPMLGMAKGLLNGDRQAAMDAVQETWVRVIKYGSGFKGRSSVKTWLYRILIHACADIRAKRFESGATDLDHEAAPQVREGDPLVQEAIDRLDWDRRVVVLMCYHRAMTHKQAAKALGIPIGTLKSRLHAALKELQRQLSPEMRHD